MTTKKTTDARKHYGPLAEQLIGDVTYGKGAALDTAIGQLISERDLLKSQLAETHAELEASRRDQNPVVDQAHISAALEQQAARIDRLCEAMAIEHKMTRLLFGTVMEDSGKDDQALRELVERVLDDVYSGSALLNVNQREEIRRKQEAYLTATRMEIERASYEEKQVGKF